ncbi:MAG: RNA polymerase sigma-70 factor [Tannerellaceae bacterium]|jgi:RNA polymerase sigma-70 factor (ECF subfamily)|nr:RNA polymerase sigma-70 factor [Tannerellaceae bacterium]
MPNTNPDIEAFNRLFADCRSNFTRFAFTYVRDRGVAEDLTLESFMYYWEKRESLPPEANAQAYVLTTLKHKCINHLERVRREEAAAGNMREHAEWELRTRLSTLKACEPEELFRSDVQLIVRRTLLTLPDRSRSIFIMRRYRNMTLREIADALSISVKTVEFHLSKALRAFRDSLKDYL